MQGAPLWVWFRAFWIGVRLAPKGGGSPFPLQPQDTGPLLLSIKGSDDVVKRAFRRNLKLNPCPMVYGINLRERLSFDRENTGEACL
jgi:hypothetical protein